MSVVINYVSEFISIIMTDTRISWGRNGEYGYDDDNEKLVNLPMMGWTAGVGFGLFLDNFKEELSQIEITNPDQIEQIYKETIEKTLEVKPNHIDDIHRSAITASWIGMNLEKDKIFCRLGIMNKDHFGDSLKFLHENQFFVLYPWEYLEEKEKAYEFEERIEFSHQFDGDLGKILTKMCSMFQEISSNAKSVSDICDVGIQLINSDGIYKIKFRDNVHTIINELSEGRVPGEITSQISFNNV